MLGFCLNTLDMVSSYNQCFFQQYSHFLSFPWNQNLPNIEETGCKFSEFSGVQKWDLYITLHSHNVVQVHFCEGHEYNALHFFFCISDILHISTTWKRSQQPIRKYSCHVKYYPGLLQSIQLPIPNVSCAFQRVISFSRQFYVVFYTKQCFLYFNLFTSLCQNKEVLVQGGKKLSLKLSAWLQDIFISYQHW